MYWDSLTAAGVFVSIVLVLFTFYLELRRRPPAHHYGPRQT